MSDAYTGGCACGAIRYEIADEPIAMLDCQCLDCQQMSGTGAMRPTSRSRDAPRSNFRARRANGTSLPIVGM